MTLCCLLACIGCSKQPQAEIDLYVREASRHFERSGGPSRNITATCVRRNRESLVEFTGHVHSEEGLAVIKAIMESGVAIPPPTCKLSWKVEVNDDGCAPPTEMPVGPHWDGNTSRIHKAYGTNIVVKHYKPNKVLDATSL
jgi:hypothetical protein